MNPSSNNLGLNTVVPTLVQNPSTRPPSTATTIVSNIQNSSSPINLFTNFSSGLLSSNTSNTSTSGQGQSASSRLKVEDALSYLDKVKNQFALQPQVYNQFLDIMKEFKSQRICFISIDTQEVINRVSTLFHGHPDLIVGFNTFLPPGYKIEVSNDHHGYIQVTHPTLGTESIAIGGSSSTYNLAITTPTSTTYHSSTIRQTSNLLNQDNDETQQVKNETPQPPINPTTHAVNTLISAASAPQLPYFGTTGGFNLSTKTHKQPTLNTTTTTTAAAAAAATTTTTNINNNNNNSTNANGQPVEFNHAINYVNKIKNRFHQNPNVYKTFLEILHTYQKQQKDAKESPTKLLKTFQELINLRGPGEVIIPKSIYDQNDTDSMISIDYGSCSQQGTSYRSVPRSYIPPACSGRTLLCKEVLNDHCVLFPTFTDESSSVAAKKSVFEEHMYKIEDERFELDIVMEVNLSAIRSLESVQLHMNSLTTEQLNNFQLDDQLGGQSTFTQRQAVQRIYGERASEIIDGLKRNPRVAVPIVLKRLKSKDEEWRESKKNFERFWKEQSEKYYLKSLDYMGINCKNTDGRIIRNRHLLNEIENIKEERDQQLTPNNNQPHLIYSYEDLSILDDAASLIIFLVKRQMAFAKEDKQNIKKIMYQFLPDFLFTPRGELSDDEEDDDDDENENNGKRDKKSRPTRHTDANRRRNTDFSATKRRQVAQEYQKPDDMFHLFFVNDNYYYFFRLHQLLYERLLKMFQQSLRLIEEDDGSQRNRPLSIASILRTSNRPNITVDEYYSVFLDMVRHLLDGNMDSVTYEDSLREMFGIHAYIAFTMDKIIQNCVRQLHAIVTDESSDTIMRLYSQTNGTAGCIDNLYSTAQQNAEAIYQREMETYANGNRLFRVFSFKNDRRMTTSLIVIDSSDDEDEEKICENGARYVESYLHKNEGDHDEAVAAHLRTKLRKKPRYLHRNLLVTNDPSTPDINHKKLTLEQYNRFKQYHDDWSLKNISENDTNNSINNLWLKTHRLNTNNDQQPLVIQPIVSNNEQHLVQPPYHHYQQYHIVDIEK
ncbi:unnamed protein product [Rotaria socialis]|uniref:Histone deacetylase interacting domain-containing protein n=1 Tax=Rotaria socialis TaxID=392032 RepID=A0A820X759_9BILA|nr:unnamed protein product [Rotaria socialis]